MIDRHNQHLMKIVRAALAEVAALPLEQAVRRLVAAAIEALAHTAVLYHPEAPSDQAVGALVDETTRRVVGYLQ